ncbi:MAG: VWA domain-containing protein [Acidobacteria bacterium]|nr:VWA domain-containing protein [Acidobacteriota bacterium]
MRIRNKFWAVFSLAVLFSVSLWSGPQQPPSDTPEARQGGFKVSVKVNMVTVPVTVKKPEGGFIKGLQKDDFRIYEDGVPQEITLFSQEGLPTRIAIVLDISGSVRSAWGTIMQATRGFVEHLHPEDQFALLTFNNEIRLKMDWGNETDRVNEVLGSIYCKENTRLWDTVWAVSSNTFKGIEEKKAVIIMSDGQDTESSISYQEAVEAAVRSEAAVYVVSKTEALRQLYRMRNEENSNYSIPHEALAQYDLLLRNLAYKTGGRVLYPNLFGQLNDIYAEVNEELRNQYTIGYISNNKANDGSYRNIDVRVKAPGASITARPGYYAPIDPRIL